MKEVFMSQKSVFIMKIERIIEEIYHEEHEG